MPNEFTRIFKRPNNGATTSGILSIIKNDFENKSLSQINNQLPDYAAWIAEEISPVQSNSEEKKIVTRNQLRRYYNYVKGIEQSVLMKEDSDTDISSQKAKLKFLLPKIAGSSKADTLEPLYDVFAAIIISDRIKNVKDIRLFAEFFEAILDYHSTLQPKNN